MRAQPVYLTKLLASQIFLPTERKGHPLYVSERATNPLAPRKCGWPQLARPNLPPAVPPNDPVQQRGQLDGHHLSERRDAGPVCCCDSVVPLARAFDNAGTSALERGQVLVNIGRAVWGGLD